MFVNFSITPEKCHRTTLWNAESIRPGILFPSKRWWLWKGELCCVAPWIPGKKRHSKCSKLPLSAWIHASSVLCHWLIASSTTVRQQHVSIILWKSGRGCPLVVQYWADFQSVHGLRCYANITRTRNVSEYMLVLALCLVNSRSRSLYAVACPSVVCLSSVVCNARAPYSGGWNFRRYFYGIWYLGHPLTSMQKISRRSSQENPSAGGVKHKGVAKYSDFGIEGYISETVQDKKYVGINH